MKNRYKNIFLLFFLIIGSKILSENNELSVPIYSIIDPPVVSEDFSILEEENFDNLYLLATETKPLKKQIWLEYAESFGIYCAVHYLALKKIIREQFFNYISKKY